MTFTPQTRIQTERSDQTRARILAAAIHEFSQNGLAGARTEQIAEAAGVNKALLYYYFRAKMRFMRRRLKRCGAAGSASGMAALEGNDRRASGWCILP